MTLFEECIEALKNNCVKIYDSKQSEELFARFEELFDFTEFGRIDWDKYPNNKSFDELVEEHKTYIEPNANCHIFWDEQSLPVIKVDYKSILKNLDDVLAVSFDTWVLDLKANKLIEFFHDGKITMINNEDKAPSRDI